MTHGNSPVEMKKTTSEMQVADGLIDMGPSQDYDGFAW
jgi:hypothetical protein